MAKKLGLGKLHTLINPTRIARELMMMIIYGHLN